MTCKLLQIRRWRSARVVVTALVLVAGMSTGCGLIPEMAPARPGDVACPEPGVYGTDATHALIAFHREAHALTASELRDMRRASADAADSPPEQIRHAILLSHPRAATDLPRAIELLDAVIAANDDDALAVRSLAQLLSDHLQERLQLAQQLQRTTAELKASEAARAELRGKLDALTEIERTLPARRSPDVTLPPEPEPEPEPAERRNEE